MTKEQFVKALRDMADLWERAEETPEPPIFYMGVYSKDELISRLRLFGGVWDKKFRDDYLDLVSRRFPVKVYIPREQVCRKTVTWDCVPTLSPDDEAEVDSAALVAQVGQ
jgi:hypothetical protein